MPIAPTTLAKWRGTWVGGTLYNNYDVVLSPADGIAYILDNGNTLVSNVDPSTDSLWVPYDGTSPTPTTMASLQVACLGPNQPFTNANQVLLFWDTTLIPDPTATYRQTNAAGLSPPGTNNGIFLDVAGRYSFTLTLNLVNTAPTTPDDLTIFPLKNGTPQPGTAVTFGFNGVSESITPLTATFVLDFQQNALVSFAARAQLTTNLLAIPMGDPPATPTGGSLVISCVRLN